MQYGPAQKRYGVCADDHVRTFGTPHRRRPSLRTGPACDRSFDGRDPEVGGRAAADWCSKLCSVRIGVARRPTESVTYRKHIAVVATYATVARASGTRWHAERVAERLPLLPTEPSKQLIRSWFAVAPDGSKDRPLARDRGFAERDSELQPVGRGQGVQRRARTIRFRELRTCVFRYEIDGVRRSCDAPRPGGS